MSMPVDSSAMKAAQGHQASPSTTVTATQAQPSGFAANQPRSHGHFTTVTTTVTASGALPIALTTPSHPTISRSAIPAPSSQTQTAAAWTLPTTSRTQALPAPSSANTSTPIYPSLLTPSAPEMVIVPAPLSQKRDQRIPPYIPYIPCAPQQQPRIPAPLSQKWDQQIPTYIPCAPKQQPRIPAQLNAPSLPGAPHPYPTGSHQIAASEGRSQKDHIPANPMSHVPTQTPITSQLPHLPSHGVNVRQSPHTPGTANFPSQADAAAAQAGRSHAASTQPHPRPTGDPSQQRGGLGNTPRQ